MSEPRYGAKCIRCGCVEHRGNEAEPIPWLTGTTCATCHGCQDRALHEVLMAGGLELFDADTREAVKAFRAGRPHPTLDRLRIECLALDQTVQVAGEEWFVADAQFDDAPTGGHLHLTLTRVLDPAHSAADPKEQD